MKIFRNILLSLLTFLSAFGFTNLALGAPASTYHRNLLPITPSAYDVGTSTGNNWWGNIFAASTTSSGAFYATSTTASSSFANGLNITRGCFSVNGTCLSTSAVTGSGSSNLLAVWDSASSITSTSTPAFPAGSLTLSRIGASTYFTAQHLMNLFNSPGNTSGGTFSTSTGNLAVAAGTGLIKATDSNVATLSFMDYAASSTVTIGATTTRYVGIEYNSGTPRVVHKSTDTWDLDTEFPLGTVVSEGSTIWAINRSWATGDTIANILERLDDDCYICRDSRTGGLILSNTGTRNVAVTAGNMMSRVTEYSIAAIDTSSSGSFDTYYRDGSGGWIWTRGQTQWNNSQYDNNAGSLTSLTALAYTSRWVYVMTDGTMAIVYGQTQDLDFADILNEGTPSSLPARVSETGMLVGRFIIRNAGTSPALTQSAFGTAFTAGSVTSHTGLADLAWSSSGHTGTASNLAGFDSAGTAINIATSTFVVGTLDTGQGNNELYDMNQNVETTSNVTFANIITSTLLDLVATGVRLSGADGVLTMLGLGNGNDESLTIDLDNGSANVVDIGSGTGVSTINWGSIGADYDSASVALSTVTGAVNAGGATSFEIVNGSSPTVDAIGEIAIDTTNGDLIFATSTNASYPAVVRSIDRLSGFKVGSTTQAYASSSMDVPMDAVYGFTVVGASCYVEGGTSVVINLSDASGTNDTNTITCSTTRPTAMTYFTSNNTWTNGERLGVEWGTKTGTIDYVNIILYGHWTRT